MKSILVELQCSKCMYHTYRKSETLVLSGFETQAREQLLDDTFFTMRCPRCGNVIEFLHPLAYVDSQRKFILLIKPRKDFHEQDHTIYAEDTLSKKRFLCNHSGISEKIKIFEDDFDDRTIEILKFKLRSHIEKKRNVKCSIRYYDYDPKSSTLWFQMENMIEKEMLAINLKEYEKIEKTMSQELNNRYREIDQQWVFDNYIK